MASISGSSSAGRFNRGASPLGLPYIRLRAKRYGETSPKLEERRRALSRVARSHRPARVGVAAVFVAVAVAVAGARMQTRHYYADDPLWTDDDTVADASRAVPVSDANSYDFMINTFSTPGERKDIRARNVNTIDEVPDSSWFTNRIGRHEMPIADIVRGPDRVASVSLDDWVVSGGKSTGVQPGFRMTDPSGQLYQIEIDPISNPEMASGAEIIGTAFYHAFGYHVVDVYLAELDPARLRIAEAARQYDPRLGRRRQLTRGDVDRVLARGARLPNGRYRVLVSRFADGAPLGNFRYYGTRSDDPNDVVPHEHRRELRGARVFGAWLNHDDSRGVNSLDMLITHGNRKVVKHYMFDFGSIMGSGTIYAQRHRAGNEYILDWKPGWLTLATFGLYTRPWMHTDYPTVPPSVGRFEGDAFDAARWKPEYPNAAFENMRRDDAFWAARIVSRIQPAAVRAVVEKARFSDPRATEYLTETLLKRREKVLRTWLTPVNPLVDFAIGGDGVLTFANAAVQAGVATAASRYICKWAAFDNTTGVAKAIGETTTDTMQARVPPSVLSTPPEYLQVEIAAEHDGFPAWKQPIVLHFHRHAGGWRLVGVRRSV